ncbi:hypothetical protein HK104_008600 [Borealophlyctis nickersoniae]|nr:hypothetical protein HK104_008600 [Borealophlyctis nickersoniae]
MPPSSHAQDPIETLRARLSSRTRISCSDGRTFIGHFMCTDKEKNIVLAGTEEFKHGERRFVGLIMIPGKYLDKIEMEEVLPRDEDGGGDAEGEGEGGHSVQRQHGNHDGDADDDDDTYT